MSVLILGIGWKSAPVILDRQQGSVRFDLQRQRYAPRIGMTLNIRQRFLRRTPQGFGMGKWKSIGIFIDITMDLKMRPLTDIYAQGLQRFTQFAFSQPGRAQASQRTTQFIHTGAGQVFQFIHLSRSAFRVNFIQPLNRFQLNR